MILEIETIVPFIKDKKRWSHSRKAINFENVHLKLKPWKLCCEIQFYFELRRNLINFLFRFLYSDTLKNCYDAAASDKFYHLQKFEAEPKSIVEFFLMKCWNWTRLHSKDFNFWIQWKARYYMNYVFIKNKIFILGFLVQ